MTTPTIPLLTSLFACATMAACGDPNKVTDEFDPSWDLTGALDDLGLMFRVGYRIAASEDWPNWREGNEFRGFGMRIGGVVES